MTTPARRLAVSYDDMQGWSEEQLDAYFGSADDPFEGGGNFDWEGEAELLAINPEGSDGTALA
jgi:hypothetical protein